MGLSNQSATLPASKGPLAGVELAKERAPSLLLALIISHGRSGPISGPPKEPKLIKNPRDTFIVLKPFVYWKAYLNHSEELWYFFIASLSAWVPMWAGDVGSRFSLSAARNL